MYKKYRWIVNILFVFSVLLIIFVINFQPDLDSASVMIGGNNLVDRTVVDGQFHVLFVIFVMVANLLLIYSAVKLIRRKADLVKVLVSVFNILCFMAMMKLLPDAINDFFLQQRTFYGYEELLVEGTRNNRSVLLWTISDGGLMWIFIIYAMALASSIKIYKIYRFILSAIFIFSIFLLVVFINVNLDLESMLVIVGGSSYFNHNVVEGRFPLQFVITVVATSILIIYSAIKIMRRKADLAKIILSVFNIIGFMAITGALLILKPIVNFFLQLRIFAGYEQYMEDEDFNMLRLMGDNFGVLFWTVSDKGLMLIFMVYTLTLVVLYARKLPKHPLNHPTKQIG